ncbi:MFS transporter [Clostridium polynesiense]|uniref:MFS transporter n=1 Tax=Clostridium polynesiense TaxID=1325933 RepID=UPI00058D8177|nr:MFS transporter [Clostridium polynesiense]
MKNKIKTVYPGALIILFVMMIMAAVTENTKGVFVPGFKELFNVGNKEISYMIIGTSAAYMVTTFIGGYLCEKIGQKLVLISGIIVLLVTLIMMSLSNSFIAFAFWISLNSAGLGLTAIASNTVLPIIVLSMQNLVMNLLHFFYGFGSTVGQRTFGFMLNNGISWRTLYLGISVVFAVILIVMFFIPFPKAEIEDEKQKLSFKEIISNKLIIFYMIALGTYVFAEMGTANWLVNYMQYTFGFNEDSGSLYLSAFFMLFTLGRLLGGFVVEKFGSFKVIIISLSIGLVLYTSGLIAGKSGLALVAAAGMFFAVTFPTIVASVSKVFPVSSSYITGIIVTSASFQGMILNFIMGAGNDYIGADKAIYIIPLCILTSIIFNFLIYKNTKNILVKKV